MPIISSPKNCRGKQVGLAVAIGVIAALNATSALVLSPNCDSSPFQVHYGTWGVDTRGQDKNVRPGDDFAMYAWGKWYREAEIPPGMPANWNRMEMSRRNAAMLRCAIERSAEDPTSSNRRLIASLYRSYINTTQIEQAGDAPLRRELAVIRNISSRRAMAEQMGRAQSSFGMGFFKAIVSPNVKDPKRHILKIRQSGIGAEYKEFYLEPRNDSAKAAYQRYAATMLGLIGWADPDLYARRIVELETRIAEVSWSHTESDEVTAQLNEIPRTQLTAVAPGFDWDSYLAGANVSDVKSLVLVERTAIPKIAGIFAQTPLETLKAWSAFHKADAAAPYLSSKFEKARFAYYGALHGQHELPARRDAAVELVSEALVHPVSREYIALFFSPKTKADIEQMVTNIKAGMRERLLKVDWMSPQTRNEALAKLASIHVGVGYPDTWRDFSGLHLREDDLYGNMEAISRYNWAWTVGKLHRPVDRNEWALEPFALGAMAIYPRGLLTFSMGFLQPPKYDPTADPAVNYGAIGADIGHEMGHFFDAGGAKYDSKGRIQDWWRPEDAAKFHDKVESFQARLSGYKDDWGEPVNGPATLREQMAHLTGLEAALAGYHLSLHGRPAPVIDGYTGDQRFFLSFAQMWQGKPTQWFFKEVYEQPPLQVIINDVVRNMDGWYSAFDVKPGELLYLAPDQRARIW